MFNIFLFIVGVCLGSFVNALVWRLHEQLDGNGNTKKLSKKQTDKVSIARGRSMCPHCKHTLASKDLIPVISWCLLRGKCRYCKKPISIQYPLVELLTGALFVVSYLVWPLGFNEPWAIVSFISWLAITVGLIALAIYDIKYMLLPDRILFPLFGIAIISLILQFLLDRSIYSFTDICGAVVVSGGIFWALYQMSGGKWIGGGDVKLGLLVGLLLSNPIQGFLFLFVASLLGLLYTLPLMLTKKLKPSSRVPFGPFLITSAFIVVFWSQNLINWYSNTFLNL